MCGIIAGCSTKNTINEIIIGLSAIEYRGYDSSGMSYLHDNKLIIKKSIGNVSNLSNLTNGLFSNIAIAHTRWATHGKVTLENAHPHTSNDEISIVHNGIIENYLELKQELLKLNYNFTSNTDSEVIAHLFHHEQKTQNDPTKALLNISEKLTGSFSLVLMSKNHPNNLYAACSNSPLILGQGANSNWLASDALALSHIASELYQVPDRHIVSLSSNGYKLMPMKKEPPKNLIQINLTASKQHNKDNFSHFMLKEIHQQPEVWRYLLDTHFNNSKDFLPKKPKNIHIIGCGSSFHAAVTAQYWLESIAHCSTKIHIASEYNYRTILVPDDCLLIIPSQSGETADALLALKKAKTLPYSATLALCNVTHSTLAREASLCLPLACGPEIGVASTKAFTSQLWSFYLLACYWEQKKTITNNSSTLVAAKQILANKEVFKNLGKDIAKYNNVIFIGQGLGYPTAQEAALKLKEISYIHAHAYPAGELKHGPLALIDENLPVLASVMLCNNTKRMVSHLKEISARSGKLIIFHQGQAEIITAFADEQLINLPECDPNIAPMLFAIAYQLTAYFVAIYLNRAIDQPRNLAKSVTVC